MLFWKRKKKKKIEKDKEIDISINENVITDNNSQDSIGKSSTFEIEEISENEKLTEKLDDMAKFLDDRGFFIKEYTDPTNNKSEFKWKIGPLGVLIRQNVLRWWWSEVNHKLQNIIALEEISNERSVFLKYKEYAKKYDRHLPFGISRVKKIYREQFESQSFVMTNDNSRFFIMEFFVPPDNSSTWLTTWKEFMDDHLTKVGLSADKLDWNFKKLKCEVTSFSDNYYYEKFVMDYKYPFGFESVMTITNKIDFDFESILDLDQAEQLKIKDKKTNVNYFPHIIEIKLDVEKIVLALLLDKYVNVTYMGRKNISTLFTPLIAPIKCGIFPLTSLDKNVIDAGDRLHNLLKAKYRVVYESKGTIDNRIKHFREFGVPFFITIDSENIRDDRFNFYNSLIDEWYVMTENEIMEYIREQLRE